MIYWFIEAGLLAIAIVCGVLIVVGMAFFSMWIYGILFIKFIRIFKR